MSYIKTTRDIILDYYLYLDENDTLFQYWEQKKSIDASIEWISADAVKKEIDEHIQRYEEQKNNLFLANTRCSDVAYAATKNIIDLKKIDEEQLRMFKVELLGKIESLQYFKNCLGLLDDVQSCGEGKTPLDSPEQKGNGDQRKHKKLIDQESTGTSGLPTIIKCPEHNIPLSVGGDDSTKFFYCKKCDLGIALEEDADSSLLKRGASRRERGKTPSSSKPQKKYDCCGKYCCEHCTTCYPNGKTCKNCKYFKPQKEFSNPTECTNPNIKGLLYLDLADECFYYEYKEVKK